MGRLANGRVIQVQIIANGAYHHLAGVHPDAHLEGDPVGPLDLGRIVVHGLLHRQGRIAGPHGMIFMGNRRPEQGHNPIAHDLIHGAFIAMHGSHHALQHRVDELPGLLRVTVGQDEFQRPLQVRKEHRDLLALAFQGTTGGEDFLREIGGRVGERGRGLHGFRGGGRCGLTHPDQHRALLIDGTLVDLNDFHLQVIEVRVIEVELALERPVRDAAALAEQRQDLVQHSVKVHDRLSTYLSGSTQTASEPWGPCLRSQDAARHRRDSE